MKCIVLSDQNSWSVSLTVYFQVMCFDRGFSFLLVFLLPPISCKASWAKWAAVNLNSHAQTCFLSITAFQLIVPHSPFIPNSWPNQATFLRILRVWDRGIAMSCTNNLDLLPDFHPSKRAAQPGSRWITRSKRRFDQHVWTAVSLTSSFGNGPHQRVF